MHFNNIVCCGVVHHCSHTSHIIHDDKLAYYKDVSGHYRDCNGNSSAHVQGKPFYIPSSVYFRNMIKEGKCITMGAIKHVHTESKSRREILSRGE